MQNPTGRKKNITGQAKDATTHGEAQGQRPVGNQGGYQGRDMNRPSGPSGPSRPSGSSGSSGNQGGPQRPSNGNQGPMRAGGGGGKMGLIIVVLLLLLGGGGLSGLFGGGGDTGSNQPVNLATEVPYNYYQTEAPARTATPYRTATPRRTATPKPTAAPTEYVPDEYVPEDSGMDGSWSSLRLPAPLRLPPRKAAIRTSAAWRPCSAGRTTRRRPSLPAGPRPRGGRPPRSVPPRPGGRPPRGAPTPRRRPSSAPPTPPCRATGGTA